MDVYTKTGDDGTTGLFYGGRVAKDSAQPTAYGDVDEAQAFIGLVRPHLERDGELDTLLVTLERDLYVLMAELATAPENHHKLTDGVTRATAAMVDVLEGFIDDFAGRFEPPTEFVVPGGSQIGAGLDVARTVVRRSERSVVSLGWADSMVAIYLNRLSDLLWTIARWQDGTVVLARGDGPDSRSRNKPAATD